MLFKSLPESIPFLKFQDFYLQAEDAGQPFTEAGCISSVDQDGAPHARYVNFKYFFEDNLIFFSSYTSNKALDFDKNQKVAINFWWPSIDVQIRAEGIISKCPEKFSDDHFYGGNIVILDHGGGLFSSYSHMQKHNILQGELVKKGTVIGFVGSTGRVTGPHLHWTIYLNENRINPELFIELDYLQD